MPKETNSAGSRVVDILVVLFALTMVGWWVVKTVQPTGEDETLSSPPRSVRLFFYSHNALAKAGVEVIQQEANASKVTVLGLLHEAVDSAQSIQASELDDLYPGLGDQFLLNAVVGAEYFILAVENQDQIAAGLYESRFTDWNTWWLAHYLNVVDSAVAKYDFSLSEHQEMLRFTRTPD